MSDERLDFGALRLDPVIKGVGEDYIGKLGLLVALPAWATERIAATPSGIAPKIAAVLAKILGIKWLVRYIPSTTAVVHHSRFTALAGSLLEQRPNLGREEEMGEMVRLHLGVTSVFRGLVL